MSAPTIDSSLCRRIFKKQTPTTRAVAARVVACPPALKDSERLKIPQYKL
jgi:hypothetical protein